MDAPSLSARHIQELKILRDIRKLLMSMELLKTQDNVLASDDLYPHGSDSDEQQRWKCSAYTTRAKPLRTQSMYCRPTPHLSTASTIKARQGSSSSPSNQSSPSLSTATRHHRQQSKPIKDREFAVETYLDVSPSDHFQKSNGSHRVENREMKPETPSILCADSQDDRCDIPNIEQSPYYQTIARSIDPCYRVYSSSHNSGASSTGSEPLHQSPDCDNYFSSCMSTQHEHSNHSSSSSTQSLHHQSINHKPRRDCKSKGEKRYLKSGQTTTNSLSFYPSRKAKCLQKNSEPQKEIHNHVAVKRSPNSVTERQNSTDDLLDGRSLFGCSSKSPLYFGKPSNKTVDTIRREKSCSN